MLSDIDRRLLRHFQADATLTTAALAERVGVATATCWRRLEKLERAGIVKGVVAVIDWRALGWQVEVSLRMSIDKTVPTAFDEVLAAARKVPEVTEIQTFLGRVDMRLDLMARDMEHYQEVYRKRILTLPHIADIEPLLLIGRVEDARGLPI